MVCKKCGKENDEKDLYCVYCGALMESEKKPEEKPAAEVLSEKPEEKPIIKEPVKETPKEIPVPEEQPAAPVTEPVSAKEAPVIKPAEKPAAAKKQEKPVEKKTSQKKVNSSVKIAVGIVLLLGIAFLATGFALGLFNDIGSLIERKVNNMEAQKALKIDPAAHTLAGVVLDGETLFDCYNQREVALKDILGEKTISYYALVDLNGDGGKELILRMADNSNASGGTDEMQVLHQNTDGVLGKVVPFREMQVISEFGTFKGNVDTETDVYYEMKIEDQSMESVEFARATFISSMVAQNAGDALEEVSLEEFTRFINRRFGARTVGFKEYSEEELRRDLENPDGYNLIEVQELGMAYWSVIIPELGQYNDLIGASYSKFEKREKYVYSDAPRWGYDAEHLLCCATGGGLKYVGTDNSIYDAEYLGVRDDAIIMSGAATDARETLAQDFILSNDDFENIPAKFCIKKAEGKEPGVTALVWSCGDTYLCIFVSGDTEELDFYNRPVSAVCYVMKECSSILGYPQMLD